MTKLTTEERARLERRVRILEEDAALFGLVTHEQAELYAAKNALAASPNSKEQPTDA